MCVCALAHVWWPGARLHMKATPQEESAPRDPHSKTTEEKAVGGSRTDELRNVGGEILKTLELTTSLMVPPSEADRISSNQLSVLKTADRSPFQTSVGYEERKRGAATRVTRRNLTRQSACKRYR